MPRARHLLPILLATAMLDAEVVMLEPDRNPKGIADPTATDSYKLSLETRRLDSLHAPLFFLDSNKSTNGFSTAWSARGMAWDSSFHQMMQSLVYPNARLLPPSVMRSLSSDDDSVFRFRGATAATMLLVWPVAHLGFTRIDTVLVDIDYKLSSTSCDTGFLGFRIRSGGHVFYADPAGSSLGPLPLGGRKLLPTGASNIAYMAKRSIYVPGDSSAKYWYPTLTYSPPRDYSLLLLDFGLNSSRCSGATADVEIDYLALRVVGERGGTVEAARLEIPRPRQSSAFREWNWVREGHGVDGRTHR